MLRELHLSLSLVLLFACGLLYQLTLRSHCFFACLPPFMSPQRPKGLLSSGRSIVFIETSERVEPPPLVSCAVESAAKIYPEQPIVFFMKGLRNATELTSNTSNPAFSLLSAIGNVFFVPLDMKRLFEDTPLFSWYTKVSVQSIRKVCVGREKQPSGNGSNTFTVVRQSEGKSSGQKEQSSLETQASGFLLALCSPRGVVVQANGGRVSSCW